MNMSMGRWMATAGLAGMMAWLAPTCIATASAQCCGSGGHAQHPQKAAAREQQTAAAGKTEKSALTPPAKQPAQPASDKEREPRQTLPPCPVTGEPIVLSVRTITDDGPVYFSSETARELFKAEPEKYAEKAAAQREALKKVSRVQVNCPVTGHPIDGKTEVFTRGNWVKFCCDRCVHQYDSMDNTDNQRRAYDAKLEASYTYQTRCPVSGDEIDPTAFLNIDDDLRIYFCCVADRDAFVKAFRRPPTAGEATTRPNAGDDRRKVRNETEKPTPGHEGHGGSHP